MMKYARGGIYTAEMGPPPVNKDGMPGTEKKRPKNTAGSKVAVKKAAGGYVRAADGCATKGKTKGTMVKMARGGDLMMARGGMTMMRGGDVKKMRG